MIIRLYLEGTADQTDDSELTSQGTQPPGTQVVPETQTKVPENGNTKENDAPVDNAAKTAVPTSKVDKEPESETPWELDENGLRIFGEEPVGNEPELILHSSISNRWKKYLSDGLKKEVKDSLLDKYPRKGKLSFEPPILNEEVTVNLKDSALKRDKYFCLTQKLAGSALSALAPVIESLVPSKEPENVGRLEKVWDAAKLLIEIHRSQTVARKACILPTLSKQWATALEKRTTDSYLFGEKLVDKVKEIKAIGKVAFFAKEDFCATKSFKLEELVEPEEAGVSGERKNLNTEKTTDFQVPVETIDISQVESISTPEQSLPEPLISQDRVSIFAGRLRYFLKAWKSITSDEFVIQCVKGYKIPFKSIPVQNCLPPTRLWSKQETIKIRDFAKVVGSIVACCPAVEYSLLHCRLFERAKVQALSKSGESTLKQYNGTLKLWWQWNKQVNENPYVGSVEKILKFLSERFSDGVGHSALNSARAAL
ncbi:Protein of unknown function, partial [Cotesia congregata]